MDKMSPKHIFLESILSFELNNIRSPQIGTLFYNLRTHAIKVAIEKYNHTYDYYLDASIRE